MELITSRDNPKVKTWVQLLGAKGIKRNARALVSGRRIVPELLAQGGAETLIYREGMAPLEGGTGIPAFALARDLFGLLDELGTDYPLLVRGLPDCPGWLDEGVKGLVVAIAAQDPSNLGSVLRSALAFGASACVLLEECAHPFLPRVTRAASGANFHLRLFSGPSIRALPPGGYGLDMGGDNLFATALPEDLFLVLGEEGQGLPTDFSGRRLSISIAAEMESLNVAVAAGIALAEYRRQHGP